MQFRSRPFWMREISSIFMRFHGEHRFRHIATYDRFADGHLQGNPVPCFHVSKNSNLAWRKEIIRKTGKKTPSCFFLLATWQALTKIEDETNVPVPLLDLQKLLDPERRLLSHWRNPVDYKDTVKKIRTNFWTQRTQQSQAFSNLLEPNDFLTRSSTCTWNCL